MKAVVQVLEGNPRKVARTVTASLSSRGIKHRMVPIQTGYLVLAEGLSVRTELRDIGVTEVVIDSSNWGLLLDVLEVLMSKYTTVLTLVGVT